jgi:uncharacterized protein YutE (UPF0331/DUF86 family)
MSSSKREEDRVAAIALEYRGKGYAVHVHPTEDDLPSFAKGFDVDVVAMSPTGNVIVQVRAASRFDADQAKRLAEVVERNGGWRYEVAFVSPPVAPDVPVQDELADDAKVSRLLENAETLSREGHLEAAGLIAWSALETVLRRRAQSAAPEIERQSSARVLNQIYELGGLNPQTFEKLHQLMQFRNAVAHGFEPRTAAPSILEMIEEIRHLQSAAQFSLAATA